MFWGTTRYVVKNKMNSEQSSERKENSIYKSNEVHKQMKNYKKK